MNPNTGTQPVVNPDVARAAFYTAALHSQLDGMIDGEVAAKKAVADCFKDGFVVDSFRLDDLINGQENAKVAYECKQILSSSASEVELKKYVEQQISYYPAGLGSSAVDNMQRAARHAAWISIFRSLSGR
jgi:hypothetical protein